MGNTIWLTNGTNTFEVPLGSPLEKRLLAQGYEECANPAVTAEPEPEGDKEPEGEPAVAEAVEPEGEPAVAEAVEPEVVAPKAKAK
jgi:hypothetical protein